MKKPEFTEKQKDEAKKNPNLAAEQKMYKGYLMCKSAFELLKEHTID